MKKPAKEIFMSKGLKTFLSMRDVVPLFGQQGNPVTVWAAHYAMDLRVSVYKVGKIDSKGNLKTYQRRPSNQSLLAR